MKKNRRLVWLGVAVLLVASAGGVAVWLTRPSPLRLAFDRIAFSQDETDVVRLVAAVPGNGLGHTLEIVRREWEGVVDGDHRTFRKDRNRAPDLRPPGYFRKSLWYRVLGGDFAETDVEPGVCIYSDRATGHVIARERWWVGGADQLQVLFDADGRVAEKVYFRCRRPGPAWWEWVRETVEGRWPVCAYGPSGW